ncbi:MAG TPA: response regulator transcription factor [Lacisediminihabitans sp.]|uniref:response regulator transcription factor n=1 Tax=Lacisediminihabitans sp. TaxID=2787631 RepID=UPI002EDB39F8
MTIRVLIVDDQPMYRLGVAAILNAQPDISVVGEAGDGQEAISRNRVLNPDVVLMDIRMPVMNGIEATRAINNPPNGIGNVPRVVILTTFDLDDYVYDALRAGASGFLLKDAGAPELISAVRTVHDGDALLSPRVTRRLIESFVDSAPAGLTSKTVFNSLTERELEVFLEMARGKSNSEIGKSLFIAEQTAKTHVSRVIGKLGLRDRVHAVVLAYETGMVRPGETDG